MTEIKEVMTACFSINQIPMIFPPFIPMCLQIHWDILLPSSNEGTSAFTDSARQSLKAGKRL